MDPEQAAGEVTCKTEADRCTTLVDTQVGDYDWTRRLSGCRIELQSGSASRTICGT